MFYSIEATNYRNLKLDFGVSLKPLSIFVGPNGSGKSNFVRVLSFVQDALTGTPEKTRGVTRFEDAIARFGSGRILNLQIERPAVVQFDITLQLTDKFRHGLELELDVKNDQTVTIRREALFRTDGPSFAKRFYYYQVHTIVPGEGVVAIRREGKNDLIAVSDVSTTELAFNRLSGLIEKYTAKNDLLDEEKGDDETAGTIKNPIETPTKVAFPIAIRKSVVLDSISGRRVVSRHVGRWKFYEASGMDVAAIRRARPELGGMDTDLSASGDNLALVLYNLSKDDIQFEDRLTKALTELFPQTRRVRFITVGRYTVQMEWYVGDNARPFYLDEMSDGTVRMLCWMAVLLSPKQAPVICLDEPEGGIHPAWLRVLAGWVRNASRRSQVIVSTHNSDFLDYFTDDLDSIRVFEPITDASGQISVRVLDEEKLRGRMDEGWKLGDLYRVGDPTVGGWPW